VARFRRAAELHRAAGEDVRSLLSEASIAQVLSLGRRSAEARETIDDVLARCQASGNPTALSWAYYVSGVAWADDDPDRALTDYSAAIQYGTESDSRLFVMLARSYSLALTASSGPPARALDEFQRVIDRWERLGNELAQWWVLLHLVVLLSRIPNDWDAAVIAGAVAAARDRQPQLRPDTERLDTALANVHARLGASAEEALALGARLELDAAVAHARRAIATAQQR
jgi:tetratricopeptide (TPR) repeat protein